MIGAVDTDHDGTADYMITLVPASLGKPMLEIRCESPSLLGSGRRHDFTPAQQRI